jgi:hypothetical protein
LNSTQEETILPPPTLIDDLNRRVRELLAQAQSQFRATGLTYSEKLHQFFVELGQEDAPLELDSEIVTSATPAPNN